MREKFAATFIGFIATNSSSEGSSINVINIHGEGKWHYTDFAGCSLG